MHKLSIMRTSQAEYAQVIDNAHKSTEMCTCYPNYAQVQICNHRYDKIKLFRYTKQSVSSLGRLKRGLFFNK